MPYNQSIIHGPHLFAPTENQPLRWTLLLLVILTTLYCWHIYTQDLTLIHAWKGWSPAAWLTYPGGYDTIPGAYPSGIENYAKSSFMHAYPLARELFGISPEGLTYIVILLQIILIIWAYVYLARSIKPDVESATLFFIIILVIASPAREMNLARFGVTSFNGLYYVVADALRIFALAQFIRGRQILASLLVLVSLTCHLTMGLFAALFMFAMMITPPHVLRNRKSWVAIGLFLAGAFSWLFFSIGAQNIDSNIPLQLWVKITRAMSFHWYPVELKIFSMRHHTRFIQFLGFLLLFGYYLKRLSIREDLKLKFLFGTIFTLLLVAAGVFFSIYPLSSSMIKLALHRANDIVVTVGLIVIVIGLQEDITKGAMWQKIAAIMVLISPFWGSFYSPGFPVLWELILVSPAYISPFTKSSRRHLDLFLTLAAAAIALLLLGYWLKGISRPLFDHAYAGSPAFLLGGSIIGFLFFLVSLCSRIKPRWSILCGHYLLSIALFVAALFWLNGKALPDSKRILYQSYLDAQRWACEHTDPLALFAVDPTLNSGWRTFSQRTTWGSMREWLYSSWAYNSNIHAFNEGLRRFNEFGLELDNYLAPDLGIKGFKLLRSDMRNTLYEKEAAWFTHLGNKYGIDYFVLKTHLVRTDIVTYFPVAYQNSNFIILKIAK